MSHRRPWTGSVFGATEDRGSKLLRRHSGAERAWLALIILSTSAVFAASAWHMRDLIAEPAVGAERASAPPLDSREEVALARESAPASAALVELDAREDEALPQRVRPADRRAWKESDFYAEFRADPELGERAGAILASDAARSEKMALLRALYDSRDSRAAECFAHVLAAPAEPSDERSESVARAALHWLELRAPREATARAILSDAWAAQPPIADELRAVCALASVRSAPRVEWPAMSARIERERDPSLAAQLTTALAARASLACASGEGTNEAGLDQGEP